MIYACIPWKGVFPREVTKLTGHAPAALHGGGDRLLDGAHLAPGVGGEALEALGGGLDRVGGAAHVAVQLLPGERRGPRGAGGGAGGGGGGRGGGARRGRGEEE